MSTVKPFQPLDLLHRLPEKFSKADLAARYLNEQIGEQEYFAILDLLEEKRK